MSKKYLLSCVLLGAFAAMAPHSNEPIYNADNKHAVKYKVTQIVSGKDKDKAKDKDKDKNEQLAFLQKYKPILCIGITLSITLSIIFAAIFLTVYLHDHNKSSSHSQDNPADIFDMPGCLNTQNSTTIAKLYQNFNHGELYSNQTHGGSLVNIPASFLWLYIGHCLNICGSTCANTLKKFTQVDSTKGDIFNFIYQGPFDLAAIDNNLNNPDMKIICKNNNGENGANFVNLDQSLVEGGRGGLSGIHFIINLTNKFFVFCGGMGGNGGAASMRYQGGNGGKGGNAGYYAAGGDGGDGTAATLDAMGSNGANGGDAN